MEPIYMIEVFLDELIATGLAKAENANEKKFVVTLKFGPIFEFSVSEGELVKPEDDTPRLVANPPNEEDICRYIRSGKSYTFPAYPDTLIGMLKKFPFEVTVWTTDETEEIIFVGCGKLVWSQGFYDMIRDSANHEKKAKTVTIKQDIRLSDEGYCKKLGSVSIILRITSLGHSITSSFQQIKRAPDYFLFRSDKTTSIFKCKRRDNNGDDPNFVMLAPLYESATLEDPDIQEAIKTKVLVCTELENCGIDRDDVMFVCGNRGESEPKKPPISKIKLKDIKGPCGNPNCAIARRIKDFIRMTDSYKSQFVVPGIGRIQVRDSQGNERECGNCYCPKPEVQHRRECPRFHENQPQNGGYKRPTDCNNPMRNQDKNPQGHCNTFRMELSETANDENNEYYNNTHGYCPYCQMYSNSYLSDNDQIDKTNENTHECGCRYYSWDDKNTFTLQIENENPFSSGDKFKSGLNLNQSQDVYRCTNCNCVPCQYNIQDDHQCYFHQCPFCRNTQYWCRDCYEYFQSGEGVNQYICTCGSKPANACHCDSGKSYKDQGVDNSQRDRMNNVDMGVDTGCQPPYNECLNVDEECNCLDIPPTALPTCGGKNCQCREKAKDRAMRAMHKKWCEAYPHKPECPVLQSDDEEDEEKPQAEEESDEEEKHPLGLPPIKLGPCPVLGRPCCVKDGFANMYKVQAQKALPKSYDDAGKICCSDEFNRIKKYLQDYMKPLEPYGTRECSPAFSLDLAGRCCDKGATASNIKNLTCCAKHRFEDKI